MLDVETSDGARTADVAASAPLPPASAPTNVRWARRLRVHALWALVRAVEVLTRVVPPLGAPALGGWLGKWVAGSIPPLRRAPLRQIQECYGAELSAKDQRALVREMFGHLGRAVFELLRLRRLSSAQIHEIVRVEGLEHFEKAKADGKGFIIVTCHLGHWELLGAWLGHHIPLSALARLLPNWKLNEWLVATRAVHGVKTVYRGSFAAARESIRALHRGEALAILIDQDTDVDGAFVPFFGKPAFTPTGAAALAQRTGAPLVPTFIHREGGVHHLTFEPPILVEPHGDKSETQRHYTAVLTERIEQHIRRHPEQWVWMHRRFKTRPPAEASN